MRLFIAVDLPGSDVFHKTYERLRKMGRNVRPTKPDDQHITLKFLGDPGCSVKRVIDSLDPIQDLPERFHIKLDEMGAFPGWNRPSVLWVGSSENDTISSLAGIIDRRLNDDIGIPQETRPFRGHITLARIKGRVEIEPLKEIVASTLESLMEEEYFIPVESVKLKSSTLTPEGAVYETLFSRDLIGTGIE